MALDLRTQGIIKKLQTIPHLKLDIEFDSLQMLNEIQKIENWYTHTPCDWENAPKEKIEDYTKGYRGVSLFEFNSQVDQLSDYYYEFHKPETRDVKAQHHPKYKEILFHPTPLLKELPYIARCIDKLSDRMSRVRIMQSAPDHHIPWHSHNNGPWHHDQILEAIVHIPIVTNPKVLHVVGDYRDPAVRSRKGSRSAYQSIVSDPKLRIQNYKANEVWNFNGWHDHYFHNYGDQTRTSILMYLRFEENHKFLDLLERSIERHTGFTFGED